VLLASFVIQLGAALDAATQPLRASQALDQAFGALSKTSIGGGVLLLGAVVILTILTQAFSFEAIRLLEGYWGTNRIVEWVARQRCNRHRRVRERLDKRLAQLTATAWSGSAVAIEKKQGEALVRGGPLVFTPNMISALGARVLEKSPIVTLTAVEAERVAKTDWKQYAPPDLLRRRVNVQKRQRDYPKPARTLPTRLGNVLRHHEDKTGWPSVETMVQEVFDELPISLRVEHDEQRTRLDLYCSMVFVTALIALVAIARLASQHWWYPATAGGLGIVFGCFMYRAALASARAYGGLLITIAAAARRQRSTLASKVVPTEATTAQTL
jgi:hypothetical protein